MQDEYLEKAEEIHNLDNPKWEIDTSTGTPILVYEKCSVIQDEQAHEVLRAFSERDALKAKLEDAERDAEVRLKQAKSLTRAYYLQMTKLEAAEQTIAAHENAWAKTAEAREAYKTQAAKLAEALEGILKSEGAEESCSLPDCDICKFYTEARSALAAYKEGK